MNRKDAESTVTNVEGDLILIRNGDNLGFGAGCNVGLRFILGCADFDYVWLLNNDTVVDSNALVALINEARRVPDAGMIGSTLRYYDRPNIVQALGGGTFSLKTCSTHHVGEGLEWSSPEKALEISKRFVFAYIVGASILLSKDLLLSIGILHERYFLYFEEIDLATRALRRPSPFQLSYAPDSIVFHKEGASTGTNRGSISSLRWLQRSRIMFVSSFYPSHSLFVRLLVLVDACRLFIKLKIKASVSVAAVALSPVPSENERE
jgi:GT2 family glycosyltransferase